jgi:hypothetical protein
MKRREAWFEAQLDFDPQRLVFIDETWASTNMARRYGWAPKGQRLRVGAFLMDTGRPRPSSPDCA